MTPETQREFSKLAKACREHATRCVSVADMTEENTARRMLDERSSIFLDLADILDKQAGNK